MSTDDRIVHATGLTSFTPDNRFEVLWYWFDVETDEPHLERSEVIGFAVYLDRVDEDTDLPCTEGRVVPCIWWAGHVCPVGAVKGDEPLGGQARRLVL